MKLRIRDLREDKDLSQEKVGLAINVPQRTYAYYETGGRMIPPQVLCALADFYGVSVDYLLGRTDIPETADQILKQLEKK
ncbi:MAG TPA: helix-turn-helix transcriptional regulator [Candidatus Merdivicinus intestinigallinarum]|nr:helix-turn-helix transcriptional regulator [Candidatus Merdivicinus intestinigallinarum]